MAVNLKKGNRVNLTKEAPLLKNVLLKLGWKVRKTDGINFDLDVSIFMLNENGICTEEKKLVFYGNPHSPCGSVVHSGDDRTGAQGEEVNIILDKIPETTHKIVAVITIDEAIERNQNFGMVDGASASIVNADSNESLYQFDLTEDLCDQTAMEMIELYRHDNSWRLKAIGDGYAGGLASALVRYGLEAE